MIQYIKYTPDSRLRPYIDCFWVMEGIIDSYSLQRIMPDGKIDILFDFLCTTTNRMRDPGIPEIVGTMTTFFDIGQSPKEIQKIGVRFHPGGLSAFTRTPIQEFTDLSVKVPLAETLFDSSFYAQLPGFSTARERIQHIQQFLLSRLSDLYEVDKRIHFALERFIITQGKLTVRQAAEETFLCPRQFERRFKSTAGISPKLFGKIIRFRNAQNYLKEHPSHSLYTAALSCGYYDDSHMAKDFRQLGGITPGTESL